MYIDESGDTSPISQGGSHFLVLAGAIIAEQDKLDLEKRFRAIKRRYYHQPDIEIKSNFLRYANPDLSQSSPIKLNDRQKYNELEADIADFLKSAPVSICSVVLHKPGYWQCYPAQNPYRAAYIFLVERFQQFLKAKQAYGICILDPREGQVEKHYIGAEIDHVHDALRWDDSGYWQRCPNVIERVLFSTSDRTVGIQITDLYCYPIFHVFEYNKRRGDYWRFAEITFPKLLRHNRGVDGIGLKFFPETSQKGLKYFESLS